MHGAAPHVHHQPAAAAALAAAASAARTAPLQQLVPSGARPI